MEKKFATALNCIDGRCQIPVINFAKKNFKVDFVDMITEPGIDKIFGQGEKKKIEEIKKKVLISVKKHRSKTLILVGHADCAKNPVSEKEHKIQIKKGIEIIQSWNLPVKIYGIFLDKNFKPNQVKKSI